VLPSGSWSILLANPWTQTETVTVDPAIVAGSVAGYSVIFTESGLPNGANWSVTLSGTSPGLRIETVASLTRWSGGATTIAFTAWAGNYAYTATFPGYWVKSGTIEVPGAAVQGVVVGFAPGSGPPPSAVDLGLPGWAAGVGVAFLVIGASGLTLTAYRYRAKEEERGRVLVARLFDTDWELNGEKGPTVGKSR
jgi:hypothetical protein